MDLTEKSGDVVRRQAGRAGVQGAVISRSDGKKPPAWLAGDLINGISYGWYCGCRRTSLLRV
ncbi:hypothetical protein SB759_35145, partial [Pseudomonas sp. SIMBA_059]